MIFVSGGTGFLGRNLLPVLDASGEAIRVLTRTPSKHGWLKDLPNIEVIEGDIADTDVLRDAMQGCQYVINAAAKFRFWGKREEFRLTNVEGTRAMLEAAILTPTIEKFIHISSVVVIGNPPADVTMLVDESYPANPVDDYQQSKLDGELLAMEAFQHHNLPVVVLRPGAFYGPHGRYAFNKMFFEDPLNGFPMGVNGGRFYSFPTYIKDAVQSITLAMAHGKPGEIYNICSQHIQHREADRIIADAAGISHFHIYMPTALMVPFGRVTTWLGYIFGFEPRYPLTLRSYILNDWRVSIKKAEQELGFKPTPFEQGVRETLEWYQEIGVWKPKKQR